MVPDRTSDQAGRIVFDLSGRFYWRREDQEDPLPPLFQFPEPLIRHPGKQALVDHRKPDIGFCHGLCKSIFHVRTVQGMLRNTGQAEPVLGIKRRHEGYFFHNSVGSKCRLRL